MNKCLIHLCSAIKTEGGEGGAIFGSSTGDMTLEILNSTIANNSALGEWGVGGGINFNQGSLILVNTTITGNSSSWLGGGISVAVNANTKILNSIIINNQANTSGNDIYNDGTMNTYYSWYNGTTGTIGGSDNNTASYTASDLSALAYNGGFTNTSEVSSNGNAGTKAGSGTSAYYNSTDGYYFDNGTNYTKIADGTTFTPSSPSSDLIPTDQRGYYRRSGTVFYGNTPSGVANSITRGAYQYYGVVARSNTDDNWTSSTNSYYTKIKGAAERESSGTITLAGTAIF